MLSLCLNSCLTSWCSALTNLISWSKLRLSIRPLEPTCSVRRLVSQLTDQHNDTSSLCFDLLRELEAKKISSKQTVSSSSLVCLLFADTTA